MSSFCMGLIHGDSLWKQQSIGTWRQSTSGGCLRAMQAGSGEAVDGRQGGTASPGQVGRFLPLHAHPGRRKAAHKAGTAPCGRPGDDDVSHCPACMADWLRSFLCPTPLSPELDNGGPALQLEPISEKEIANTSVCILTVSVASSQQDAICFSQR